MMRFSVDLANAADDAALRLLARRQAMPGRVAVTFEREPDFFLGCAVTGEDSRTLVARSEQGEIVGVACRSLRNVFINGHEQRLGYLGQLRIEERCRGRWLVSRGFSLLHDLDGNSGVSAYLAAIVAGNPEATGVLVEKRRKLFPQFHAVADYCSLAIDVHRPKPLLASGTEVSHARADEVPDIVRFLRTTGRQRQFFPAWDEQSLNDLSMYGLHPQDICVARHGGEIAGVMALWDQSAYKQTVIQGYSGWLKAIVPIWNLGAPAFGRSPLPSPGEPLRSSAYAALVCVAQNDDGGAVFASLLRAVYNLARSRGFSYLMLGLDAKDPFLPVARTYSHILYPSRLYLAEWPDGGDFYERLDQRPAYVDIATL